MLVFIDTNILFKDFYMKNYKFELINKVGTVVLGEIVVDETCKKYRESLLDSIQVLKKTTGKINGLIQEHLSFTDIDIESELQNYRDFLEMHSIRNGMTVAEEYPKIPHKEVVARAVRGKKPFKPDGKDGYRDYLVWLTCLELAKRYQSEEIHFITDNINDFSADNKENKNILHNDLIEDLDKYNIDKSRFYYWTNLNEFIEIHVKPQIDKLANKEKLKTQIESHKDYSDKIQKFINDNIIGSSLTSNDILLPTDNSFIKNIDSWDAETGEISKIDDDSCLFEIMLDSICIIEGDMFLYKYYEMQKEYECDDWLFDIEIIDRKSDDIIVVNAMMQLYIHINGKYCISENSISELQLDYIEDSYCEFCGY